MPINIAMPVAHEAAAPNYGAYYVGGQPHFRVRNFFNRGGAEGLSLELDTGLPLLPFPTIMDLHAFTDGFLSFQANSLVLRLPRELNAAGVQPFNSGELFKQLTPAGPQLRHVVYLFPADPGASVDDKIRDILSDIGHPGRTITRVQNPAGGTQTLQAFLTANPANSVATLQAFRNGTVELFVRAGDVIGNFENLSVEIRFLDSSGTPQPATGAVAPVVPRGRPLNPSYYLFLVRSPANAAHVNLLGKFASPPPDLDHTHPLDHLFSPAMIGMGVVGNLDQVLDLTATHPAKPAHVTIPVLDAAGVSIALEGIHIGALGDWHESRNASDPFNTASPVRWRNFGTQPGEAAMHADLCRFLTQMKPGMGNLLPGPGAFDHQHTPTPSQRNRIQTYWTRYGAIFNVVAQALEIPCELLLAIACKETAGGGWFNQANFAASHEMDTIRMERLRATNPGGAPAPVLAAIPALITANAAHQARLANYLTLAGHIVDMPGPAANIQGGPNGANANIPAPWNGAVQVDPPNPLTWNDLRILVDTFPASVKASPGVLQTLVESARIDLEWIAQVFGTGFIQTLGVVHAGVQLIADGPPNSRGPLFEEWFGVAVDAAGANTVNAANVDQTLTKIKRALHNVIGGAAHIKRRYNTVEGGRNIITDFDFPTLGSGYNDGATAVPAATAAANNDAKWNRLFAQRFYGSGYPSEGPKFFNAAVAFFNTTPLPAPLPTVRLWRS